MKYFKNWFVLYNISMYPHGFIFLYFTLSKMHLRVMRKQGLWLVKDWLPGTQPLSPQND